MGPLSLLLLLPLLVGQAGEVEMRASLNRRVARVRETVLLTVTLRAPGLQSPEIEDPQLSGVEVLSTSDRSTVRYSPSLGWVREFAREYTLRVLEPGLVTIPPIRASVGGTLYETEALTITVEREGGVTDIPGGLGPKREEEVAVRLWVEPETAYVGQQVTMTVGAFFDPMVRGRLQRQPEYRPPDVRGFWTADLPGSARPERRVVGGREYFVQVYRRALFPLSPGRLVIPPAAVIYEVRRGLIYAPETFEVESAPAEVVVLPLPAEGMPDDYAGAVGRYETEVLFDRSDLRAGEAVRLVLEVTGSGNISSLTRPRFPEIPGVRVYEGGEEGEVQLRGVEFAGHKRFSWVLVPERAGRYVVPDLRLPYFDPERASYAVARTGPVTLEVSPALGGPAAATGAALRFVKARPARQPLDLPGSWSFWAIQLLPLLVLAATLTFSRYRRRAPAAGRKRPRRRRQLLRELRPAAESGDPAFYSGLRLTVLEWLESRLQRPQLAARGVVQVQNALEDAGVPPPVALQVVELLERCGRLRYAPDPPGREAALETLAEAARLLALVDAEAVSEKSLRAAGDVRKPGSLVVLLFTFAAAWTVEQPMASAQPATAGGLFEAGVAAYGRGDYAEAVELFRAALAERPRDPSLLYNLGNAYYELDRRGEAVTYWVKALRLRPRDGDARFNLRLVVGEDPVLGSALPPLPLSGEELALLFTAFWFSGCAALVMRRRRRRGLLTFAGGALLTLAVLTAAVMFYPRAEYAVITGADAVLRKGPVRQAEVLAGTTPGTGYRVEERRGEWLRVSRGRENEGWVELAQVELIE